MSTVNFMKLVIALLACSFAIHNNFSLVSTTTGLIPRLQHSCLKLSNDCCKQRQSNVRHLFLPSNLTYQRDCVLSFSLKSIFTAREQHYRFYWICKFTFSENLSKCMYVFWAPPRRYHRLWRIICVKEVLIDGMAIII